MLLVVGCSDILSSSFAGVSEGGLMEGSGSLSSLAPSIIPNTALLSQVLTLSVTLFIFSYYHVVLLSESSNSHFSKVPSWCDNYFYPYCEDSERDN